jgi:hypothetical protein
LAATHAFEQAKTNSELLHKPCPNLSDIAHQYQVSEATLCQHVKGGWSCLTAAANRSWLTEAQTQTLISHLHTLAGRRFPETHKDVALYALKTVLTTHPDLKSLGKGWVDRFLTQHADKLPHTWTSNLNHSCTAAVNPVTIGQWFDLLGAVLTQYQFKPQDIYGFDESGFLFGGDGQHLHVVTHPNASIQHIQRGGNHENMTVMVTVCGDGSALVPAILFKGKHIMKDWESWNVAKVK